VLGRREYASHDATSGGNAATAQPERRRWHRGRRWHAAAGGVVAPRRQAASVAPRGSAPRQRAAPLRRRRRWHRGGRRRRWHRGGRRHRGGSGTAAAGGVAALARLAAPAGAAAAPAGGRRCGVGGVAVRPRSAKRPSSATTASRARWTTVTALVIAPSAGHSTCVDDLYCTRELCAPADCSRTRDRLRPASIHATTASRARSALRRGARQLRRLDTGRLALRRLVLLYGSEHCLPGDGMAIGDRLRRGHPDFCPTTA